MITIETLPTTKLLVNKLDHGFLATAQEVRFPIVDDYLAIDPRDDTLAHMHPAETVMAVTDVCIAKNGISKTEVIFDFLERELSGVRYKNAVLPTERPFSLLKICEVSAEDQTRVDLYLAATKSSEEVRFAKLPQYPDSEKFASALTVVAFDMMVLPGVLRIARMCQKQ